MKKEKKNNKEKKRISKKMSFAEILEKNPELADVLLDKGMHCVGCPMAMMETLEEGAMAHGLNSDEIEKEMNDKLNKKNKKS